MSDNTYATIAGFVQFDPQTRDVNGKTVRDVAVKAIGSQKIVRLTVWPEHDETPIEKGDFIAADGKFSSSMGQSSDGSPREYLNLSVTTLLRTPAAPKKGREVVSGGSSAGAAPSGNLPF